MTLAAAMSATATARMRGTSSSASRHAAGMLAGLTGSWLLAAAAAVAVARSEGGWPAPRQLLCATGVVMVLALHGSVRLAATPGTVGQLSDFPVVTVQLWLPLVVAPWVLATVRTARAAPRLGWLSLLGGVLLAGPAVLLAGLGVGPLHVGVGLAAITTGTMLIALTTGLAALGWSRVPPSVRLGMRSAGAVLLVGMAGVTIGVLAAAAAGASAATLVLVVVGAPGVALAGGGIGLGLPVVAHLHRLGGQNANGRLALWHHGHAQGWLWWCVPAVVVAVLTTAWLARRAGLAPRAAFVAGVTQAGLLLAAGAACAGRGFAGARPGDGGIPVTQPQHVLIGLPLRQIVPAVVLAALAGQLSGRWRHPPTESPAERL